METPRPCVTWGHIYREGLLPDSDPDPEKAREWYAKALAVFWEKEQAVPSSQTEYRIARLYAGGLGVEADDAEAERWLRLAAEKENPFAQNALASLLLKQGKPEEAARVVGARGKGRKSSGAVCPGQTSSAGGPASRRTGNSQWSCLGRSAAQGDSPRCGTGKGAGTGVLVASGDGSHQDAAPYEPDLRAQLQTGSGLSGTPDRPGSGGVSCRNCGSPWATWRMITRIPA